MYDNNYSCKVCSIPTNMCATWLPRRIDPFFLLATVASITLLSDKILVDLE